MDQVLFKSAIQLYGDRKSRRRRCSDCSAKCTESLGDRDSLGETVPDNPSESTHRLYRYSVIEYTDRPTEGDSPKH